MQKIQAGHFDGSVILVGSVGSSLGLDSLSLLPSPEENEESVQLLVRPERSAGSALMVTGAVVFLGSGGETDSEGFTRLLLTGEVVREEAGRLMDSLWMSLVSTCCSSPLTGDSPDGWLRPNSGLRMFSTEKGNTLETD